MTTVYEGPGQCECQCVNPVAASHICHGYASKPFSGWGAFKSLSIGDLDWDADTRYLEYSCVIKQDWIITQVDSDMSTILSGPSVASTTRTIYLRRNRYTNDQTVEVVETGLGMYWGGVNYVGYGSGGYSGYIWPFDIDNYGTPQGVGFVNEGGFLFDNITPPYGIMLGFEFGTLECVKPEYFINDYSYTPTGDRGWKTNVTFYENYEAVPGTFMKYEVEITINEYLSDPYTLTDCKADQALLVAESSIERLRVKATEDGITATYCGFDTSGNIIFADNTNEGDGFYPNASGVDPRTPWDESYKSRSNVAPSSPSINYTAYMPPGSTLGAVALYLIRPSSASSLVEIKAVFVETGAVTYTLTTMPWDENGSARPLDATTDTWTGVEGRAVDFVANINTVKLITS